jgi:F-type H+-transporting ATPase subunit a
MAAFAPDVITQIGPLPITNTLLHTLVVDAILIGGAWYLSKRIKEKPKGFQSIIEPLIEGLYGLTESIASSKKATRAIFPFVMTFFLFIFVSNFTGLLPGIGTIGFHTSSISNEHTSVIKTTHAQEDHSTNTPNNESMPTSDTFDTSHTSDTSHQDVAHPAFIPLLRGATSDINVTLALALVSVVATHVLSIRLTGFNDYISRWISWNPINLYVGILEFVAEFTKIISLSFRLFGNIFAGEVALHTISALFAFLAPLPFLLLESIVSVVQALVFSILTLVFMAVLTTPHHHAEEHAEH